ncbi:hypothetical protein BCR44DRAFT_1013946 [Catenaria anguillulae PL171]|uniref:Vacuolar calcium ion transporter n=1 Tax=Catenaria anguillulae PL171 TaxID=765915 RepID=A0A1Y2HXP2_9FUNG|nr:hypothetical protein BCR44DRAFT_1013946 [Catenaria anguillulae PL171]
MGTSHNFWLNFLGIIPLAKILGFATEELALRTNQTIGGLLNATFGNAVEVLVSVIALNNGMVGVVQSSLLGSILSNMLLVLGFCFLLGGATRSQQEFNPTAANTSSALLSIAVLSLLVPAAFVSSLKDKESDVMGSVLTLSRLTAVILLVIYALFLFFQLRTHAHLYEETNSEEHEVEIPSVTGPFAVVLLLSSTICVAINSDYLVASIEGLSHSWGLSQTFVGLVLLPIVGNAAEHVSAVTCAMKNKMELSLGIAVGSSTQIALLVTPLLVVIGWIIGQPMTLFFEAFDTVVLFISVLIVNYLINDGRSNWLEGAMLLAAYAIIAIAYYMMP